MAINLLSYIDTNIDGSINFASTNTNILVINGSIGYITGVGNVNINWTGYSSNFVRYGTGTAILTINSKTLTVTPDNKLRISGDNNPPFTVNISGFVYNQNSGNLVTLPTGYTVANINSSGGIYNIIGSGGSGVNYNFDYKTGYLTILEIDTGIYFNLTGAITYGD
jgi:hypothetical protein